MPYVNRNYGTSGDTTHTLTVDAGSNAGRAVVVTLFSGSSLTLSSLTIDGASATALDSGNNGAGGNYYVAAAVVSSTGTITVSATWSSSGSTKRMHLMSFDGIDSVRGGGITHANGNAAPSVTLTTVSGDIVTLQGNDGAFGRTFSASSPATATSTTGSNFDAYETAAGASTTIDGTLSGTANWYAGAVALVPASSSTPSSVAPIAHYLRMMGSA